MGEINISIIFKKIIEIEEKYKTFDLKIEDVYFWKILRFGLESEIQKKKLKLNEAHDSKKKRKILILKKMIYNFINRKKSDTLIFIHDRFFEDNFKYKDIYTYFLTDSLKDSEVVYPVFCDDTYLNKDYNYSFVETFGLIFTKIKTKFIKNKIEIKKEELEKLKNIKEELEEYFSLDNLEILEIDNIQKIIRKFKNEKKYYISYFNSKNAKRIFLVSSYGRESLISAANFLNIEVVEIQHGGIDKYHIGYHFPNNSEVNYFPDKMYMFGRYWYENARIPLEIQNIKFWGYPYLNKQLNKYKSKIKENSEQVLFISQGTIGEQLTEIAVDFAKKNKEKKIIIRLHPGEFQRWKEDYKMLFKFKDLSNIEISDNNNKNLYEYLLESKYIICVYSTVIYEALYLEKKVGILNLAGTEYIDDLFEKELVYKFSKNIELQKLDKLQKLNKNYYFEEQKEEIL